MKTLEMKNNTTDIQLSGNNKVLVDSFGLNADYKCQVFRDADGPNIHDMVAILNYANTLGVDTARKFVSEIDNAYNLLVNEIPVFEKELNERVMDEFNIVNTRTMYNLIRETLQERYSDCECIFITKLHTVEKKKMLKSTIELEKIDIVAFKDNGEYFGGCSFDQPITVDMNLLVKSVKHFDKKRKIVKDDNSSRVVLAENFFEVEEASQNENFIPLFEDEAVVKENKKDNKGYITIKKKTVAIIGSVIVSVGTVGILMMHSSLKEKYLTTSKEDKETLKVLRSYEGTEEVVKDNILYKEFLLKSGIVLDEETKEFYQTGEQGDTQTAKE